MATTTDNELAVVHQETGELAPTQSQAMARYEIEGAIILARRYPRNEDAAFGRVMQSCKRWSFAAQAAYSYPRGNEQVTGPSVRLAREIARCWGNIRYGADIVQDDEELRTVRAWAWDMESNCKETQDASFRKLIFRKKGGWVKPDERDLLELTNRIAAKAVRNCILHLVPPDLISEAMDASRATIEQDTAKNPDEARRKLIVAFQGLGVSVEELEAYLGHPLKQANPKEVADLRAIWKSISDGNSTWREYAPAAPAGDHGAAQGGVTLADLTKPASKAPERPQDASKGQTVVDTPSDAPASEAQEQEPTEGDGPTLAEQYEMDLDNAGNAGNADTIRTLLELVKADAKLTPAEKKRLVSFGTKCLARC